VTGAGLAYFGRKVGSRLIPVVGEVILVIDGINILMDISGVGCGTYAGE
jgi:formate-dependent nitrite reductase membrane component NrfD